MRRKLITLLSLLFVLSLLIPEDGLAKGGRGGKSRGGTYTSGSGKSRKGTHYYNPYTGNHYQRRGTGSYYSTKSYRGKSYYKSSAKYSAPLNYHNSVKRDLDGRIIRSESAKELFLKSRGYKDVPPGYEMDHIIPLYAGGRDDPSNMQLLTTSQHRAKTKADYQRYGR